MRKTGICPKCTHNQLLLIGAVADTGELESEIREMYLAIVFVRHGFFGDEKLERKGKLNAVVCKACGYCELHVLDPQAIVPDGKYVTELSGPSSTTPFR
jgi:predicted nucleic-acid-binding Zn-ribbon protein